MRARSRFAAIVASALAVAVPIATAVAQPATLSAKDKKKIAKGYVDTGLAAQDAGDYATALDQYAKAYALLPHPVLLFNQAQAHRLAGHRDDAIAFYRQFLATTPRGSEAADARKLLATLEAENEAIEAAARAKRQQARDAEAARVAEAARAIEVARLAEETRQAAAARAAEEARNAEAEARQAEAARIAALPPAPRDRGRPLRLGGLAAVGVGVVAVGVGIAFGVKASSLSDDLSKRHAPFDPATVTEGETAERNMIIATAAGGVLIAGGATLYFLGRARTRESTTVTVAPRTDGAMVVLSGSLR